PARVSAYWAGRRLLVVVAHPDDETFGCGSVIADAAAGGAHVTVCCATRGELGEMAPGSHSGRSVGDVRLEELHEAGRVLGVTEFVVLDVGRHMALRRQAIRLHASQRSPYEEMPADLVDAFLRYDRLVRVEPPWPGGAPETAILMRQ